jgi:hypothetical protein
MFFSSLCNANIRANNAVANPGSPWNLYAHQFETGRLGNLAQVLICRYGDALQDAVSDHDQGSAARL